MNKMIVWTKEGDGPTNHDAARFCIEMSKWGYSPEDDIPVDEKMIKYAMKNDCFIDWLEGKGYIKKSEAKFRVVKNLSEAIQGEMSFFLTEGINGITLQCVAPDNTHWSLLEIHEDGRFIRVSCVDDDIGLSVDAEGYIEMEDE